MNTWDYAKRNGNGTDFSKVFIFSWQDLKRSTTKGFWMLGRRLMVRIHLGIYILQRIYNLTDREAEYGVRDNAAYQLFCGLAAVFRWHVPDHTKIQSFRSRLSPETHRQLANLIASHAVELGFADPRHVDLDSTTQEANIAYPADAGIMSKLCSLGKKVVDFLGNKIKGILPKNLDVDMTAIRKAARAYFFLSKRACMEKRRELFKALHILVKRQMRPVISVLSSLSKSQLKQLPWNIRRAAEQLRYDGWRYLLDVGHFVRKHTIKAGKILSLHAKQVTCISKGKPGKEREFGRIFQLGRIAGNFMFVLESTSLRMEDKHSVLPMMAEHGRVFTGRGIVSVATDKGYWSVQNAKAVGKGGIKEDGLQRPSNTKRMPSRLPADRERELRDRRAGIEPLIGHVKHGGQLGKSRMKSDRATLGAGYGSVFGFNLRQLIRHQGGKMDKKVG